jgi:hypothetical protein
MMAEALAIVFLVGLAVHIIGAVGYASGGAKPQNSGFFQLLGVFDRPRPRNLGPGLMAPRPPGQGFLLALAISGAMWFAIYLIVRAVAF